MPFEKGKTPKGAKPFKPGQSGNPTGMIPGTQHRSTQLRKWVDIVVSDLIDPATGKAVKGTIEDKIDVAQIALALSGNTNAYNAIKEELYGKRMQRIEQTGVDGGPIRHVHDVSQLSDDELDRLIDGDSPANS